MWSISTNILTVLANFLGIHNSILSKNIGCDRGNTKAADPTLNLFKALPSQLNPTRLCEIEMASLHILQIENFSQNMLLCATTCKKICQLFAMAQTIGMETLEWIVEAKRQCGMIGKIHSWHWTINEGVGSDLFPTLEGQLLLSEMMLEPSNSTALILHPRFST